MRRLLVYHPIMSFSRVILFCKKRMRDVPFLIVVATLAIVAAIIAPAFFADRGGNGPLPPEFLSARDGAATVSQRIVELTRDTNINIKTADRLEKVDEVEEALGLVAEARESNAAAYESAFDLSRHLQKMTESLALIDGRERQRLAYESVALELSLVSEFITYTQNLNNFLDSLSRVLVFDSFDDRRDINLYLSAVNESTNTINRLNGEFLARMSAFGES